MSGERLYVFFLIIFNSSKTVMVQVSIFHFSFKLFKLLKFWNLTISELQLTLLLQYKDELEILAVDNVAVDTGSCLMQQNTNEMENCHTSVLSVTLKLMTDIFCGFAILNNHYGKQVIIYYNFIHSSSVRVELGNSNLLTLFIVMAIFYQSFPKLFQILLELLSTSSHHPVEFCHLIWLNLKDEKWSQIAYFTQYLSSNFAVKEFPIACKVSQ